MCNRLRQVLVVLRHHVPMNLLGRIPQTLRWIANTPRALIGCYFSLLIVCGTLYSVFENKDFGNSLWWAVVTASTVGYGDIIPTTVAGRVLTGGLISIMVLLVIPLITAHFASKLIVDNDAFKHEEQEEIKNQLRAIRELTEQLAADLAVERERSRKS